MRICYILRFKGTQQKRHIVSDNATEQEAKNFYANIPNFFDDLKLKHKGLTGAYFYIGNNVYSYGSCIGLKTKRATGAFASTIPSPYVPVIKTTDSLNLSSVSTELLINELINRGYAIFKPKQNTEESKGE